MASVPPWNISTTTTAGRLARGSCVGVDRRDQSPALSVAVLTSELVAQWLNVLMTAVVMAASYETFGDITEHPEPIGGG